MEHDIHAFTDLRSFFAASVRAAPEEVAVIIDRKGSPPDVVERRDCLLGAAAFAAAYRSRGLGAGDRVVLILPTSREFLHAFWGCLLAGAVPVPVYPPLPGPRFPAGVDRLRGILAAARPGAVVTIPILGEILAGAGLSLPDPLFEGEADADPSAFLEAPPPSGPEPALIQFTSGSTRSPRGCVLSHRAIIRNAQAILDAIDLSDGEAIRQVQWLPLYHDMGLMAALFLPLAPGAVGNRGYTVLQPPEEFLTDPVRWLELLSRYRAHYSAAPNFALGLVARKLAGSCPEIDLSGVRGIVVGAEPVVPETVRAFLDALAPAGLRPEAIRVAWGLAENVCFTTMSGPGLRVDRVDPRRLRESGMAVPVPDGRTSAAVPCVGRAYPGASLRVVDGRGRPVPDRVVGGVELRSPSRMDGYFEDARATEEAFRGPWLRTGDLGYLEGEDLHLVGRSKDLIITCGRNILPQDLEQAVDGLPGIRSGNVAAFGVPGPEGTERVAVVAETRGEVDPAELVAAVRERCRDRVGVVPRIVELVRSGQVPKTSSGKLQRGLARERYLAGALERAAVLRKGPATRPAAHPGSPDLGQSRTI